MTIDEREKEHDLRNQAQFSDKKVRVVYKGDITKASDITRVKKHILPPRRFQKTSFSTKPLLRLPLFNARSLMNKSWLNSKITDPELCSIFPYTIIRKDRHGKAGGGVCVFCIIFFCLRESYSIAALLVQMSYALTSAYQIPASKDFSFCIARPDLRPYKMIDCLESW
ncbi:hypothetical protein OSTOST_17359, partial [Ostertagia ostertagi]